MKKLLSLLMSISLFFSWGSLRGYANEMQVNSEIGESSLNKAKLDAESNEGVKDNIKCVDRTFGCIMSNFVKVLKEKIVNFGTNVGNCFVNFMEKNIVRLAELIGKKGRAEEL